MKKKEIENDILIGTYGNNVPDDIVSKKDADSIRISVNFSKGDTKLLENLCDWLPGIDAKKNKSHEDIVSEIVAEALFTLYQYYYDLSDMDRDVCFEGDLC